MESLEDWAERYCLQLNPTKTTVLAIASKHNIDIFKNLNIPLVQVCATTIPYSFVAKNLGMILDSHLNWEKHIAQLCQRAYFKLKHLHIYKHVLNAPVKLKLVNALILSIFSYCDIVYHGLNRQLVQKIQKVQNSCIRYVYHINKRSHISPILLEHFLLNMEQSRILHILTFIHSVLIHRKPIYILEKITFLKSHHQYTVRDNWALDIPICRTSIGSTSFFVCGPRLWNELPVTIRSLTNPNSFRNRCHNYLLNR